MITCCQHSMGPLKQPIYMNCHLFILYQPTQTSLKAVGGQRSPSQYISAEADHLCSVCYPENEDERVQGMLKVFQIEHQIDVAAT